MNHPREKDIRAQLRLVGFFEGAVDVFFGQSALADDGPFISVDADDGGGHRTAGVAGIENEREAVSKLLENLSRVCARRKAGKIGAGARDRSTDRLDKSCDDAGIGPAKRDPTGISRNLQRQAMRSFYYESESTGPELVSQRQKHIGDFTDQTNGLLNRIDKNRQGFGLRSAFDLEDSFDGGEIERIGGKSVKRVSSDTYDATALDEGGGIIDDMTLRCFR